MNRYFYFAILGLSLLATVGCQAPQNQAARSGAAPTPALSSSPLGDSRAASTSFGQESTLRASVSPFEGLGPATTPPDEDLESIRRFKPEKEEASYSPSDFQTLMPADSVSVGQVWSLPTGAMETFLRQFHPSASETLNIDGAGSYGVVRAQSAEFLDIRFRSHVQFELRPSVYVSPAQFEGRMLVERRTQRVRSFSLSVPAYNQLNVGYEILREQSKVGMFFAPKLELSTGPSTAVAEWEKQITEDEARELLKKKFFAFEQLEWHPLDKALERARHLKRPVFHVVIAGVLNDESC